MKRAEFINLFSNAVDRGRCRRFPDMRPSERAVSRIDDAAAALRAWRKLTPQQRASLTALDVTGRETS